MKVSILNVRLGVLLFLVMILFSCSTPRLTGQNISEIKTVSAGKSDILVSSTTYYVYRNGNFEEAILTKDPELIGGKELMETLIKLNIQYPQKAKDKLIGGTVLISVVIDEKGSIEDAFVHEGIGGGCNDEALRAVRLMDKVGFEPGEIDGQPVTVKFDIPITFLPQMSE